MERKIKFDDTRFIKLWHLFYYFPRKSSWDNNAQLILDFKSNSRSAAEYLLDCALRELRGYNLNEEIFVIRGLRSEETRAVSDKGYAMDWMGQGIATGIGGIYVPQLLMKSRVTQPLKMLRVRERELELTNVYSLRDLGLNLDNRHILLLDDVVTTGVTSRSIVSAILKCYPTAKINVFALGWTPTKKQQNMLFEQQAAGLMLNEPVEFYGGRKPKIYDVDYLEAETFVAL
jgi:hypothetical protein